MICKLCKDWFTKEETSHLDMNTCLRCEQLYLNPELEETEGFELTESILEEFNDGKGEDE